MKNMKSRITQHCVELLIAHARRRVLQKPSLCLGRNLLQQSAVRHYGEVPWLTIHGAGSPKRRVYQPGQVGSRNFACFKIPRGATLVDHS